MSTGPSCSSREGRLLEVALHSILPEAIRLASATGADDLDVDHVLQRISAIRNGEERDHLDELLSDVISAVSNAADSYGGTRCANRVERVGSSMMQVRFLRLDFCGEDLAITPSVNPDLVKIYRKQIQNLVRIGIRDPNAAAEATTLSTASIQAIEACEPVAFTGTSKPCYMGGDGTCTDGVLTETNELFIALAGTKTCKDGKIYWKDGRGCAVTDIGDGFVHLSEGNPSTLSGVTAMHPILNCIDHDEDDTLSLPYVELEDMRLDGINNPRVCEWFRSWLEITSDDIYFTGGVEFLGSRYWESRTDPGKDDRVQMLHVEVHGIEPCEIELPRKVAWKDGSFLQTASPNPNPPYTRFMLNTIQACLDLCRNYLSLLSDERYRPGWFEKASGFLVDRAIRDGARVEGRVEQRHMSITSTMLKVKKSRGSYYLKSPACCCNETKTTAIVSKLFREQCAEVVGVFEDLNCFVSREFDVEAGSHVRDRFEGCELWDLTRIVETTGGWNDTFLELNCNPVWFEDAVPVIAELCEELKEFQIPMTLVHGHFFVNNTAQVKRDGRKDVVLFDWEYSYIGHPFFDFHRIHKYVPEEVREEYLNLWTEYEDIERLRRAYEAARNLGWAVKGCLVLGWAVKTMKRGSAQDPADLSKAAFNFTNRSDGVLCPPPEALN